MTQIDPQETLEVTESGHSAHSASRALHRLSGAAVPAGRAADPAACFGGLSREQGADCIISDSRLRPLPQIEVTAPSSQTLLDYDSLLRRQRH
jgi:hypothetical protein